MKQGQGPEWVVFLYKARVDREVSFDSDTRIKFQNEKFLFIFSYN